MREKLAECKLEIKKIDGFNGEEKIIHYWKFCYRMNTGSSFDGNQM
jgi:hypothetical protein